MLKFDKTLLNVVLIVLNVTSFECSVTKIFNTDYSRAKRYVSSYIKEPYNTSIATAEVGKVTGATFGNNNIQEGQNARRKTFEDFRSSCENILDSVKYWNCVAELNYNAIQAPTTYLTPPIYDRPEIPRSPSGPVYYYGFNDNVFQNVPEVIDAKTLKSNVINIGYDDYNINSAKSNNKNNINNTDTNNNNNNNNNNSSSNNVNKNIKNNNNKNDNKASDSANQRSTNRMPKQNDWRIIQKNQPLAPWNIQEPLEPFKININEMKCVKSAYNSGGRFSIDITSSYGIYGKPMIEGYSDDNPNCVIAEIGVNNFRAHFEDLNLAACGVHYCATDSEFDRMCLILRFPIVPGLKTSQDLVARIRCKPQAHTISQTRHFKMKSNRETASRSLPVFQEITGGENVANLNSHIALYRRGKSGFTLAINENDAIALGEEVQLRSIVKEGDGWYYSRLGEVKIRRQRPQYTEYGYNYGPATPGADDTDSVVIMSPDGCTNPLMKAICPLGQIIDPNNPLITLMNINMFIFDGMKDGDELLLSATLHACVHHEDCYQPEFSLCNNQRRSSVERIKRQVITPNTTTDQTSKISFKISLPDNIYKNTVKCEDYECIQEEYLTAWISSTITFFAALLSGIMFSVILYLRCKKNQIRKITSNFIY